MKKIFNILYLIVGVLWLTFMMGFPSDYRGVKYILLSILLLTSFFEMIVFKQHLNRKIIVGLFFMALFLSSKHIDFNK